MSNEEIMAQWLAESGGLASVQTSGGWAPYGGVWQEITLPFTTLTNKVIRIFIQRTLLGRLVLTDQGDLSENAYQVKGATSAYTTAEYLLGRDLEKRRASGSEVFASRGVVWCEISKDRLLGRRLFDMGQLLQLAVNLAVLETDNGSSQPEAEGRGRKRLAIK